MNGDYRGYQNLYGRLNANVDILTGTASYADVLAAKSANHTVYVQKITLSILTHVADTYTFDDDGAGPAIAVHLDVTPQAAGVPAVVVFDFGPEGVALTKGANLDVSHSSTGTAKVHIEGYQRLTGAVAPATTN